jgi:NAD(P)-dependent dehydrogenase (short-subunit alcohol dehydrogenase family)
MKQRNIRVNAISPDLLDTPGLSGLIQSQQQDEQLKEFLASTVPLGRMGSPEEVAKAVSILAFDVWLFHHRH